MKGADSPTDFLRQFDPAGWHNLVSIVPDGPITGHTFPPGSWDAIDEWIGERAGSANLYFSVNEPVPNAPNKKLDKAHIRHVRAACVDVDPLKGEPFSAERQRLERLIDRIWGDELNAPNAVIDSGGGFQMFWLLEEKLDAGLHGAWAEAQNRGLAARFGGDKATHNIDRVLRLPGTINLPDARKRSLGRVAAPTRVAHQGGWRFKPKDISAIAPPAAATPTTTADKDADIGRLAATIDMAAIQACDDGTNLPTGLWDRFAAEIASSNALSALWSGGEPIGEDTSGSGYRGSLAHLLRPTGRFTPQEYGHLLWVWDYAVQGGDREEKINARQIARDWVRIGRPSALEEFEAEPESESPLIPTKPESSAKRSRLFYVPWAEAADRAFNESSHPLIEGLIDQEAMVVVYGASGSGKTFVSLDLGYHIGAGLPWQGRATAGGMVAYVAAEGGRNIFKRVAALRARYKAPSALAIVPCPINLREGQADVPALVALVRQAEAEFGQSCRMIVVDTLSRALAGGEENGSVDMGAFVKNVDRLRDVVKAAMLVVHHTGKDAAKGARGHSLLRAATDTEIEIVDSTIKVTKQRDMEMISDLKFHLVSADLGADVSGRQVRSSTIEVITGTEFMQIELSGVAQEMFEAFVDMAKQQAMDRDSLADWRLEIVTTDNWERQYLDNLEELKGQNSGQLNRQKGGTSVRTLRRNRQIILESGQLKNVGPNQWVMS